MSYLIIVAGILYFIGGVANGLMDSIVHHWKSSIPCKKEWGNQFWNPDRSWINKYKKNAFNKERFFLSKSLLVFLTDGWHLCKSIMLTTMVIGAGLLIMVETIDIWRIILVIFYLRLMFYIGFITTYR